MITDLNYCRDSRRACMDPETGPFCKCTDLISISDHDSLTIAGKSVLLNVDSPQGFLVEYSTQCSAARYRYGVFLDNHDAWN